MNPDEVNPLELIAKEGLAIVWARDKACREPGWQHTQPWVDREEWEMRRRGGYEPGITLRTSGLVGIEVDGPEDTKIVKELLEETAAVPLLVEIRKDKPGRAHLYFRRPRPLDADEDVSFRCEGGVVTGAVNNYYRCFGGDDYTLHRYRPEAPALTEEQYRAFVAWERSSERLLVTSLRSGEPLNEGSRRCTAFRLACLLFRWSDDETLVCQLVDQWNQATCQPALGYGQVAAQVRGAYRLVSREDGLKCDLERHSTPTGRLTTRRLLAVADTLVGQLARKWAEPELAASLTVAYLKTIF